MNTATLELLDRALTSGREMAIEPHDGSGSSSGSTRSALTKSSRRLVKRQARGLSARTTCIHPQLRDLLVCPETPGQVVAHAYHSLAVYDMGRKGTKSASKTLLQTLNFFPNVLVKGCGLLAAGGHTAEFALRSSDPNSKWCIQMQMGRSINNSASITPHPFHPLAVPRIHACNNDKSIYVYDVHFPKRYGSLEALMNNPMHAGDDSTAALGYDAPPDVEFKERIRMETPINHASVSPDGRSMVAVGDSNHIFVFDINAHGQHTLIDTLEVTKDASFSTSWSRTGDAFAVASQDGSVTVFDRRRLVPLHQFRTYQRGSAGAARVVKYSQGSHELLAFSEHKNYIHVVDARTYDFVERIYLPGVQLTEHTRAGHAPQPSELASDLFRHPLLSRSSAALRSSATVNSLSSIPTTSLLSAAPPSVNPWDTVPEDSLAWPAVNTIPDGDYTRIDDDSQDCPPLVPPSRGMPWLTSTSATSHNYTPARGSMAAQRTAHISLRNSDRMSAPFTNDTSLHPLLLANSPRPSSSAHSATPRRWPTSLFDAYYNLNSSATASTSTSALPSTSSGQERITVADILSTSASHRTQQYTAPSQDVGQEGVLYDDDAYGTFSYDSAYDNTGTAYGRYDNDNDDDQYTTAGAESVTALLLDPNGNPIMMPPSSSAVTGLDWDPSGRYLYASMERIILEWEVDSHSRRCHPVATVL